MTTSVRGWIINTTHAVDERLEPCRCRAGAFEFLLSGSLRHEGVQAAVAYGRGSLEMGDMLSNLSAKPMEVDLLGRTGHVHEGFMAAATFLHCNTAAALATAARDFPGWPLVVTGHSMGGTQAPATCHYPTSCCP